MYYPKSTWKLGAERVVHGPEEHYQAQREGWGDEKDPDTEQRIVPEISESLQESTESYEASEALLNAPKRRGRPPKVQSIAQEVA